MTGFVDDDIKSVSVKTVSVKKKKVLVFFCLLFSEQTTPHAMQLWLKAASVFVPLFSTLSHKFLPGAG